MGFGTLFVQVITLALIITVLVGAATLMKDSFLQSRDTYTIVTEQRIQKMDESIQIMSSNYFNQTLTVHVRNTGRTIIDFEKMDMYVNDVRIPRDPINMTIAIRNATHIKNPGLWDPLEEIEVRINITLNPGTHYVEAYTGLSNYHIQTFNVI